MKLCASKKAYAACIRIFGLLILVSLASGCIWGSIKEQDVSAAQDYWGGYRPGEIYTLQQDVFLRRSTVPEYVLIPEGFYDSAIYITDTKAPRSIAEFMKNPEKFPGFSILGKGTRLQCKKITVWGNISYREVQVFGVVLDDDEYKNKLMYLNILSTPEKTPVSLKKKKSYGLTLYHPNPKLLRK